MITVEEASRIVSEHARDFGTESVSLNESMGRVLRQSVFADRDLPPYDRVTMDGIGIVYDSFANGQTAFPIEGVAAAGDPQKQLQDRSKCLEVMTGAIMPEVADTVIPYEMVDIVDGVATLTTETIKHQQNIHFKGFDRKTGDQVLKPGVRMASAEIGVCATTGQAQVEVSKLPRTIIISTGDELVDIDQQPLAHQIRRSNVYRLQTVLQHYHLEVTTAHLQDDYDSIVQKIGQYLEEYDLIMLSGGVSKGKFDFLPQALEELGVVKHFHKIKQRPGKPFWFGTWKDQVTVFAFPGNPVSSFMCMQQYFKPWLDQSLQLSSPTRPMAKLAAPVHFKPDLTYFLEVRLTFSEQGELLAHPAKGNGSGDLANLADADAFIVLPRGRNDYEAEEVHPIISYREGWI